KRSEQSSSSVLNASATSPIYTLSLHDALPICGDRPPLFFMHPGGGNISCYVELAHQLGSEQPFYGLQSRGLDENHVPLTLISDMACYYVETLRRRQPEGPYMLGGWSMGGLIAYEMAQQLRSRGEEISLLALLDS